MTDRELFGSGKYYEIIDKYKENIEKLNEWELYYLCKSYYKIEDYSETINVYNKYIYKNYPKERLLTLYLWSIYYLYVKNENKTKASLLKSANFILQNCSQQDKYSPYYRTVYRVIEFLEKEKVNPDYASIYFWCSKLKPELLSGSEKDSLIDGRNIKVASEKEKWYATITKASIKLGLYEETIKLSKEALNKVKEFHNNNDIWFRYKMAISYRMLGNDFEAVNILEKLLLLNEHFCLRSELGDIYRNQNNIEKAKKYYYDALNSRVGSLKNKITLIEKMADLLREDGDLKLAKLNYLLVIKIRENEGWKIDEKLNSKIKSLDDIEINYSKENLEKLCRVEWEKNALNYLEKFEGEVIKILPNNKAGFIKFENGQIYFKMNSVIGSSKDIINRKVSFYIKKSYDVKKGCESTEAIKVKIIL